MVNLGSTAELWPRCLEGVVEVDQTEIPFRADNSFFDSQSQVAEPFVWTKSEVHRRRVKG
jgi:hypothetical protein